MRRELGMFVALVVMCLGLWFFNHDFLGYNNVQTTGRDIAMLGIFSIGIAFVIITGGIDLSIGSVVGLTGVIIAKISGLDAGGMGYSLWIGIPVALLIAALIGLVQGLLITRLKLQSFIVTLGFMLLLRGVSQTIVQGGTLSIGLIPLANLANGGLTWHGTVIVNFPVLICLAVILIAGYILHFTVFGRYVYAIGGNRDAAEYSGIPVNTVETLTYVISALTGGLAGVCYASSIGQMSQQVGVAYELYAIAAAVLGGVSLRGGEGTVIGVMIGSCIMRVIDNGINMFQFVYLSDGVRTLYRLDTNKTNIIIGGVILIAVILDQIIHIAQAARRTRRAGAAPPTAPPPNTLNVVPPTAAGT